MKGIRATTLIVLWAVPLAGGCLEAEPRGSVELELLGAVYPRPRCAKGLAAMGQLHPNGDPVAGARVSLSPGRFEGTTGADGRLTLEQVPEGIYTLTINGPARMPAEPAELQVRPGEPTRISLHLDPCVFGGGHRHNVGFDTEVTLTAASFCGDAWKDASYSWTQLEGPELRDTVSSWSGQQLSFTTAPLEQVRSLPDQPQILSFSPDQAGQYVFLVTAQNSAGEVAQDYVLVTSTSVAGGLNSVPPGDRFYFLGEPGGPWNWEIVMWPEGWVRTLEGAETRTPSVTVIPDGRVVLQQTLVIQDTIAGTTFSLVVGGWDMVNRDCGTARCHPPLQQSWEATRHASTWQKMLDGELVSARGPAGESCASCHAVGYDPRPGARNGGYDDVAEFYGVSFPEQREPGAYDALPEAVKEVSNVYCVACHGPARVDPPVAEQPGRFAAGVCARCHDRLPEQDLVAQWRTSRMAQTIKGELNGPESKAECTGCHSSQGFYYNNFALGRPPNPDVVVMSCCENLAPITCQTCHSPMYADNQAQIFRYGAVTTRSGLQLSGVGAGALCITCHNTDHDLDDPSTLAQRLAPHSPQADLSYGKGGYLLPAEGYAVPSGPTCARDAGEGCVNCHMEKGPLFGEPGHREVGDHTFRVVSKAGVENVRPCQACHPTMTSFDPLAQGDYDGNAEVQSVRVEVDGLMALLEQRLAAAIQAQGYRGCDEDQRQGTGFKVGFREKVVVTDLLGFDLGDCDRSGAIERDERPFLFPDGETGLLLHKAAYNYLLIQRDKSRGLHNHPYAVTLLQRTLVALSQGKGLPAWDTISSSR